MANAAAGANLGAAMAVVGFTYNPAGSNAFLAAAQAMATAQAGLNAGQQIQASGAQQATAAVKGVTQAHGQLAAAVGRGFSAQSLLSIAGGLGIATGIGGITREIVGLVKESIDLAVKAQVIGTAFEAATKRASISSVLLLDTLKSASRGTVSTANLEMSANKALALGVGANAQQIGDLLAIARQKGKDFGIGTNEAFDNIATGLGRLSPRILDNLGIILDENKIYIEYAKSIGVVAGHLSDQEKRQALVNELIKDNSDLIIKNARAQLDASDLLAQAQAGKEQAQTRLGTKLIPVETRAAFGAAGALDAVTGGFKGKEADVQFALTQVKGSLVDLGNPLKSITNLFNLLADAEQHQANTKTAAEINQVGDAYDRAAQAAERLYWAQKNSGMIPVKPPLPPITDDERKVRGDDLKAAIIQGGNDLVAAQGSRDKALLDLDKQYSDADGKLFGKLQTDLTEATAHGAADRARLVAQGAKQITDLIAAEGVRASRQAQDRATQDGRTARSRREEDATSAADFAKTRAALIASQHDKAVKDEEAYQRDLARATRQGQENQYVSTASFLERLFGLTRGHRNKAELAAGQVALKAAQAEAAELAKTDPAAAAALLAEREKQITDAIQRKRDEAQLRRDAKRGGGLSPAEVEAEIAQEDAAIKAANEAAIAGIKAGAKDKADDRARQKTETDTANKTAVDDLDKNEADRRAKLNTARKEQDGDLATDRAREDQRRAQDYAKQLADLRTSNADALRQFDTNQADKIKHIQAAIDDEKTKYADAHTAILKTYDTLAAAIQEKIDTAKRLLDVSPAAEDVMRQETALRALGRRYGQAFLDAYCDALGIPRIVVGAVASGPIGTGSANNGGIGNIAPPGARPAPPARGSGGSHSQSIGGVSLFDRPALPRTPAPAGPVTSSRALTLDLRGARFGGDLTEPKLRQWIMPLFDEALNRWEHGLDRETTDMATRGALT